MFRTLAKLGGKGPFSGLDIGAIEFYAPDLPYKHTFMGYVSRERSSQRAFLTATWNQIFGPGGAPE